MTRSEVVAAIGEPDSPQACRTDAPGTHPFSIWRPYQAAGFQFRACLVGNDENGLMDVTLSPDIRENATPAELLKALTRKYGTPVQSHAFQGSTESEWHQNGDKIVLSAFAATDSPGAIIMIDYAPLPGTNTKGL